MKIEMLDQQTVKIILSYDDMSKLSITYDDMDYSDPETRFVIMELLQKIKKETTIDLTNGKLFIEAFPYESGGCILYINVLTQKISKNLKELKTVFNEPIVFVFDNFDNVCDACINFFQNYNHLIFKSSLYSNDNKYYMMIYSFFKLDKKISSVMSEYGHSFGKGELIASHIREYGKCIIGEIAIEKIAEKFK